METFGLKVVEYINYLVFSEYRHLLLEGRTDKKIFEMFIEDIYQQIDQKIPKDDIFIECVEGLIIEGNLDDSSINVQEIGASNCKRVEYICERAIQAGAGERVIGFVDREFREFEHSDSLQDVLQKHQVIDNVVWSRGHSIENYCFDKYVLQRSFQRHSKLYQNTDYCGPAFQHFEHLFDSTIQLACAYSLLALEADAITELKNMIEWSLLEISPTSVDININVFMQKLMVRGNFKERAGLLIERFQFWKEYVKQTELSCARWMCHGHIGAYFLLYTFETCVFKFCMSNGLKSSEAIKALHNTIQHIKVDEFFLTSAVFWIRQALLNKCEYPKDVFVLLGLSLPNN